MSFHASQNYKGFKNSNLIQMLYKSSSCTKLHMRNRAGSYEVTIRSPCFNKPGLLSSSLGFWGELACNVNGHLTLQIATLKELVTTTFSTPTAIPTMTTCSARAARTVRESVSAIRSSVTAFRAARTGPTRQPTAQPGVSLATPQTTRTSISCFFQSTVSAVTILV